MIEEEIVPIVIDEECVEYVSLDEIFPGLGKYISASKKVDYELNVGLDALLLVKDMTPRPTVVCLCGSTRFLEAFRDARLRETLAGRIVLSLGSDTMNDTELERAGFPIDKQALGVQYLFQIDMADEILVLNVGGYVGESTRIEIEYARRLGKRIQWLEEDKAIKEKSQNL